MSQSVAESFIPKPRGFEDIPAQFASSSQAFEKLTRGSSGETEFVYMKTFAGRRFKSEGSDVCTDDVQPTRKKALDAHIPALKDAIRADIADMQRPLIFWRMEPSVDHLTDGGYVAFSRYGVYDLKDDL